MNIFEFLDYHKYLVFWIKSQPKKGRGILKLWSEQLGVHATLLSQVLSGKKELSLELGEQVSQIMGHTETEADYFLLMVLYSRAGSESLSKKFRKKILAEQEKAKNIGERLNVSTELSDQAKAVFYSSWIFSGIRNLVAISDDWTAEKLGHRLQIPRESIQEALEFLLKSNLLVYEKGKLKIGHQRTHIRSNSPFVANHHRNWRAEGQNKMLLKRNSDLFFTFPMSLSKSDAEKIRRLLPQWIEDTHRLVETSPSEVVRCLNIDYFEY